MGALHVNGQKATGLNITLADGVFIDADNLIDQGTFTGTMSYTATEDCAFIGGISQASSTPGSVTIDGVSVYSGYMSNTVYVHNATYLLKKGQTITLTSTQAGWDNSYKVYGILQGTIEGKLQPVIYSLEEREIGVWTDGKPLYEKTIVITAPTSDETTINHNISNADYIYVKEGTLTKTGNGTTPYETYHSSSTWACGVYNVSRTNFTLFVGSSLRQYVNGGFITFRYTKTTDTPGSSTWTPDGAYAHHYSTDEKVVGTWTNGSTLYEKTIDFGDLPNNTTKNVAHNISNLNKIVSLSGMMYNSSEFYSLPFLSLASLAGCVQLFADSTNVSMATGTNRSSYDGLVTIQYTKSSS